MSLRRLKTRIAGRMPDFDRLKDDVSRNIDKISFDKPKELTRKIGQAMPKSGEDVGRRIERRLAESQKVWKNTGMVVFGEEALERMSMMPKIGRGILMLILTVLILIFPVERSALAADLLIKNFFFVLVGIIVAQAITYISMMVMGSKTKITTYFSTVNTALFLSLLIVSLPLAIVAVAIFSITIQSDAAISMFFTLIPFYNYLIFGWASESMSKLKGVRGIAVALISLLVLMVFNLIIPQII
jgi:membrane-associated HD superfamily phosphohydrolase